ncbi:MAG: response regulator [Candidatus Eremiobacterota bacterium]
MSKKILIVDDEPYMRILMEQALEDFTDRGVRIFTAENGVKAIEVIKKEKPDLVFLDVMMPEMDGYDVCSKVKKDADFKNICVILLTARGQEIDKKMGMECGANDYITKPFDPDVIIGTVSNVLDIEI